MTKSRIWIALTAAWFCVLSNVHSFDQSLSAGTFVFAWTALAVAVVAVAPRLRTLSTHWISASAVGAFLVAKAALGHELAGSGLTLTLFEAGVVGLTVSLVCRMLQTIDQLETAAKDAASLDSRDCVAFETSQGEIYREVRRARQFERPLSLLTIAPSDTSVRQARPQLVKDIQHDAIGRYVRARIADVLSKEMLPSDLIVRRNGHFVVLVPEANRERTDDIVARLKKITKEEVGIDVRVGTATFPDEEITFVGLLERAEASMAGVELRAAAAN